MSGAGALEAVARALAYADEGGPEWPQMTEGERDVYREPARVAIAALDAARSTQPEEPSGADAAAVAANALLADLPEDMAAWPAREATIYDLAWYRGYKMGAVREPKDRLARRVRVDEGTIPRGISDACSECSEVAWESCFVNGRCRRYVVPVESDAARSGAEGEPSEEAIAVAVRVFDPLYVGAGAGKPYGTATRGYVERAVRAAYAVDFPAPGSEGSGEPYIVCRACDLALFAGRDVRDTDECPRCGLDTLSLSGSEGSEGDS